MTLPVLIITYNRFELVLTILEALNKNHYKKVYIAVDHYPRDAAGFSKIEAYLEANHFNYQLKKSVENIGCERNVITGIQWFFEHEERGIILEDDCIPTVGFFSFLEHSKNVKGILDENISFFSNCIEHNNNFYLYQSYIPFFWGWYTNRNYFKQFYEFVVTSRLKLRDVLKLLTVKDVSLRIKLIVLINYVSFSYERHGTSWDSLLHYYQFITKKPFLVPTQSMIDNRGFGNLNVAYTHTNKLPDWYNDLIFSNSEIKIDAISVSSKAEHNDTVFLNQFFKHYSHNVFILIGYFCKQYFKMLMQGKRKSAVKL